MNFSFVDSTCERYVDKHYPKCNVIKKQEMTNDFSEDIKNNIKFLREHDYELYDKIHNLSKYTQYEIIENYLNLSLKPENEVNELVESTYFNSTEKIINSLETIELNETDLELIEEYLYKLNIVLSEDENLINAYELNELSSGVKKALKIGGAALGLTAATVGGTIFAPQLIPIITPHLKFGGTLLLGAIIYAGADRANLFINKMLEKVGSGMQSIAGVLNQLGGYWKFRQAIIMKNTQICYSKCKVDTAKLDELNSITGKDYVKLKNTYNKLTPQFCLSECYVENYMQSLQLLAKSYFTCLKNIGNFSESIKNTRSTSLEDIHGLVVSVGKLDKFGECKQYYNMLYQGINEFYSLLDSLFDKDFLPSVLDPLRRLIGNAEIEASGQTVEKKIKEQYFLRLNEYLMKAYNETKQEKDVSKYFDKGLNNKYPQGQNRDNNRDNKNFQGNFNKHNNSNREVII